MTTRYDNENKNEAEGEESKSLLHDSTKEEGSSLLSNWNNNKNDSSSTQLGGRRRRNLFTQNRSEDDEDGTLEKGVENDLLSKTKPNHSHVMMTRRIPLSLDRRNVALYGSWLLLIIVFFKQKSCSNNIIGSVSNSYVGPDIIYGFVHIGKTAGTEINGELALRYERICGNKGYSYDAYQHNLRADGEMINVQDAIHTLDPRMNRGKVPRWLMAEIGFEDCDWIAQENIWKFWTRFKNLTTPMELHVPCRSPIDHLMSQCNYRLRAFDCQADDLMMEIMRCHMGVLERFNMQLTDLFPTKCFSPVRVKNYVNYMSTKLQKRRFQSEYIHRNTNFPRNKTNECIWNMGKDFQDKIKTMLIDKMDYYKFCEQCMGSEDELSFLQN